jgi:hypothetical protein
MKDRCEYFYNGQVTIDRVFEIIDKVVANSANLKGAIQPIAFMLLDF